MGDDGGVARHQGDDELNFSEDCTLRVCVRKRPIFRHEVKNGEFDVVTCMDDATSSMQLAVVHDARMHADMRRMLMRHNTFSFDKVFSETADNDEVYRRAALTSGLHGYSARRICDHMHVRADGFRKDVHDERDLYASR